MQTITLMAYCKEMPIKDADGIANNVDSDQTAPADPVQTALRSNLNSVYTVCPYQYFQKLKKVTKHFPLNFRKQDKSIQYHATPQHAIQIWSWDILTLVQGHMSGTQPREDRG